MKFTVRISNKGRSGCISALPQPWNKETFKSPFMMTYTRAGAIPHLTYNSMQRLVEPTMIMQQTLPTIAEFKESVSVQGKGLSTFVGLPEFPFYVSVQDPGSETLTGYNVNKGVSVWDEGGKKLFKSSDFMSAIKAFKPAFYQALTDSDTPLNCSKKRLNKSVDNSIKFLDDCLEEHCVSTELEGTGVFGTIQGAYDAFLRKKSAQETAKRTVDGFVFDGFHVNGSDVENVDWVKLVEIIQEILPLLPEDKPRLLPGAYDPGTMLQAIKLGIDIFDSSYAYRLSESGQATVFDIQSVKTFFEDSILDIVPKKSKSTSVLCLKDDIYKVDFSPILEGCGCYTCCHYTRAYVNHLLLTSELLAYILLMIHNLHHLFRFFKAVRHSLDS